jgi:cell fate regulator YaaT (PSP1 superfamily)
MNDPSEASEEYPSNAGAAPSEGSGSASGGRTGGAAKSNRRLVVRCGVMRTLCALDSRQPHPYGTRVLCKTPRGTELGEVLCEATAAVLSQLDNPPEGYVLRRTTEQDEIDHAKTLTRSDQDFAVCQRWITQLALDMQIVDIERVFGGERVVIFYLAEQRVDFRQLVRELAVELQTRIEMRQIGVRDEAKLLADYGDCGKPVCCNTHLSKMPPVSMRMAKLQKATLDPAKISGRCGRLKCCLRYEYDTYEELQRELPPPGSQIVTESGRATVLHQEILSQQLLIQTEDKRRILISASDVLSVTRRGGGKKSDGDSTADNDLKENG